VSSKYYGTIDREEFIAALVEVTELAEAKLPRPIRR
jgi:hypothetical protein